MYVNSQTELPWLKTFISSPAIIALLKKEAPYQSGPKEHVQRKTEVLCWEGKTNEHKNAPPSRWSFSYIDAQEKLLMLNNLMKLLY